MSAFYRGAMKSLDKFVPVKLQPMWNHAADELDQYPMTRANKLAGIQGDVICPKTVFFWAPLVKWGLVAAGIGDIQRPVDKLSVSQSASLAATGLIWSRYSLVIIPKNYGLFSVNLFVCLTQVYQLIRIFNYRRMLTKEATVK